MQNEHLILDFLTNIGQYKAFKDYLLESHKKGNCTLEQLESFGVEVIRIGGGSKVLIGHSSNHSGSDDVELYYTGGGIWIAQKTLENGDYFVVSSDFPTCLTMYSKNADGELFLAEDMIFSADGAELTPKSAKIYAELLTELKYRERYEKETM